MKYSSIDVDDFGRVIYCPFCGVTQYQNNDTKCPHCETPLINMCSDTKRKTNLGWEYIHPSCQKILDGNARYCIHCGNQSTFLALDILDGWENEKRVSNRFSEIAVDPNNLR